MVDYSKLSIKLILKPIGLPMVNLVRRRSELTSLLNIAAIKKDLLVSLRL